MHFICILSLNSAELDVAVCITVYFTSKLEYEKCNM